MDTDSKLAKIFWTHWRREYLASLMTFRSSSQSVHWLGKTGVCSPRKHSGKKLSNTLNNPTVNVKLPETRSKENISGWIAVLHSKQWRCHRNDMCKSPGGLPAQGSGNEPMHD